MMIGTIESKFQKLPTFTETYFFFIYDDKCKITTFANKNEQ